MNRKTLPLTNSELRIRYEDGETTTQLAEICKCSRTTITDRIRKVGGVIIITKELLLSNEELRIRYETGESSVDLAKICYCCHCTIIRHIAIAGGIIRSISEATKGKKLSPEQCIDMSKRQKGTRRSPKACTNISKSKLGKNNPAWKGGISFGKYCFLFNNEFKKQVRDSYNNHCFLCGKSKDENGANLSVHHINYDKDCLCGSPCEFVPLCRSCHVKTNNNRKYWEELLMCYLYPERYFMVDI